MKTDLLAEFEQKTRASWTLSAPGVDAKATSHANTAAVKAGRKAISKDTAVIRRVNAVS
jgi:hypothetical protein